MLPVSPHPSSQERMQSLERLRRDVDKQRRGAEKRFKRSEKRVRG